MKNKAEDLSKMKEKQNNTSDLTKKANTKNTTSDDKSIIPSPVLGEKAEDYLREQANIEDMPDSKDEEAYDKKIAATKNNNAVEE